MSSLTFDASSIDRLGLLRDVAEKARCSSRSTTTAATTGSGRSPLVDVDGPATAVVARELVERLGDRRSTPTSPRACTPA